LITRAITDTILENRKIPKDKEVEIEHVREEYEGGRRPPKRVRKPQGRSQRSTQPNAAGHTENKREEE
jgi:hypothetical protein